MTKISFPQKVKRIIIKATLGNKHYIGFSEEEKEINKYDEEVLMTQIRALAHFLDKEMQTFSSKKMNFSEARLENVLKRMNVARKKKFDVNRADFKWAEKICRLYASAIKEKNNFKYEWIEKSRLNIVEAEFIKLLTSRRSIRSFTMKEVSNEIVQKIISLGNWAPITCNMQLRRYIVVKNSEIRSKISAGGMDGNMSPCIIVVVVDMRFYPEFKSERAAHETGAAVQNILLAAHYYGLGSCYVAGPSIDSTFNRRLLAVEEYEKIVAFVWLGYYKKVPITPVRRDINELIRHI